MPGRKSDRATIEARQHRLAELLAEGMKPSEAAVVLQGEGYPASHDTVQNDVVELVDLVKEKKLPMIIDAQIKANERLQELEDDVELALLNKQISLRDRVAMALDILKQRRELLGLDAPKKSISAHIQTDQSGRFHQVIEACAGLDDEQFANALALLRATPRKQLEEPAGPPTLELTEGSNDPA